jgi:hypothetical protein
MDITHRVTLSNREVLSVEENPRRSQLAIGSVHNNDVDYYICNLAVDGVLVMTNSGDACYCLSHGLKKPETPASGYTQTVRLSNGHQLVIHEDPAVDMLHIGVKGPADTSVTACCTVSAAGVLIPPRVAADNHRAWEAHLRNLHPAEGPVVLYHRLTAEQKMAYLRIGAGCPHCASNDLDGGEVRCEGDHHYQTVSCNACHRTWLDTYTLSDVTDEDDVCALCKCAIADGAKVVVDSGEFHHAPGTCKTAPN